MKIMICVVHDQYSNPMQKELSSLGYRLTKLSSSGGFLKKGNTTFLIGAKEEHMDDLLEKMKEICLQAEMKKGQLKDGTSRFTSFVIDLSDSIYFLEQMKQ